MLAYYDLDLDQDTTTGFTLFRQCIGGPILNFGTDALVNIEPDANGRVGVYRVDALLAGRCDFTQFEGAGYGVVPLVERRSVTVGIPVDSLRDDGAFAMSTLFVQPGANLVTDVVPDSVAWVFGGPGPATAAVPGEASRGPRPSSRFAALATDIEPLGTRRWTVRRIR